MDSILESPNINLSRNMKKFIKFFFCANLIIKSNNYYSFFVALVAFLCLYYREILSLKIWQGMETKENPYY